MQGSLGGLRCPAGAQAAPWPRLPLCTAQAVPRARSLQACASMQVAETPTNGKVGLHQLLQADRHRREFQCAQATNITWQSGAVSRESKQRLLCQRSCVIWFTGLSGAGKSTVACALEHALHQRGVLTALLDGDNVRSGWLGSAAHERVALCVLTAEPCRHGLNSNLGFSAEDRAENIRRVGEVSKLFVDAGVIAIASFISPYAADRDAVRRRLGQQDFVEVYMQARQPRLWMMGSSLWLFDTMATQVPLSVCEERDTKGLYKLARQGKIKGFTGIDDPYEVPQQPEVVLEHTDAQGTEVTPEAMAAAVISYLEANGHLQEQAASTQARC